MRWELTPIRLKSITRQQEAREKTGLLILHTIMQALLNSASSLRSGTFHKLHKAKQSLLRAGSRCRKARCGAFLPGPHLPCGASTHQVKCLWFHISHLEILGGYMMISPPTSSRKSILGRLGGQGRWEGLRDYYYHYY